MEDFNLLIDGKRSFVMLIKNKEETYEQMIEMRRKKKRLHERQFIGL